jgi:hypothetical protein
MSGHTAEPGVAGAAAFHTLDTVGHGAARDIRRGILPAMPKWRLLFWFFVVMALLSLGSLRTTVAAHHWRTTVRIAVGSAAFAGAAVYVARRRRAERGSA